VNGRRTHGRLPRQRGVVIELQPRDRLVFKMLVKAGGVLTTRDFIPLAFPSHGVAVRRLRKLHDAGYVCCFVEQLHYDNRWVLDTKAWQELPTGGEIVPQRRRAPDSLAPLRPHRATLLRFWSLFVAHCHATEGLTLKRFSFEWELPDELFTTGGAYRPDALAIVDDNGRRRTLLIEVDTGTESPSYVAKHKIAHVETLVATGERVLGLGVDTLIFLIPSDRRHRSLARATKSRATPSTRTLVFTQEANTLDLTKLARLEEMLATNKHPGVDAALPHVG